MAGLEHEVFVVLLLHQIRRNVPRHHRQRIGVFARAGQGGIATPRTGGNSGAQPPEQES